MPTIDRLQRARDTCEAFASGRRGFIEACFTDDFEFSSPGRQVPPQLHAAAVLLTQI
jgi:hypothetical protein